MAAQHMPRFSPEQYLELERRAEYKSEYFDGEIFAMAGGTYAHFRLIANLTGELYAGLRGKPCFVGPTEMRVLTRPGGLYTYPDIVAVCGEPRLTREKPETLLNPVLIIEVLSKSTELRDRGLKLREYRQIESLKQYVLVAQNAPSLEVYSRNEDGLWNLQDFQGEDTVCELTSVGCSFRIGDIYRGVPPESE